DAINKQLAAATDALAKVDADLAWQATGVAADIAGTIDPTPVSDLVSAGVSVRNGDLWGAALSTVSMVPYLGDAVAKPVKAVRATKAIAGLTEKATALRKTITDLTKAKKEAEAAAEITAKEAKIAKEAEAAKDAAAQQEKSTAKKAKDCEDCELAGKKSSIGAKFGKAASNDYKATFFKANPELQGKVVVHHAVEQQVLKKFPGVVSESEMHSLENLRGIPTEINGPVHLSEIRVEWNRFYKPFIANGTSPTKEQLLKKATEIDLKLGSQFKPKLGN
ncbi:hypothetical protein, partial [Massilia sp. Root418]|uniref:hypothetical protein n=1 Tax=Massilia sp. Root418 TaxID=1736532 RepID=UPI000AF5863E